MEERMIWDHEAGISEFPTRTKVVGSHLSLS